MAESYRNIPDAGSPSWKEPVATVGDLPTSGNGNGDARAVIDTGVVYVWDGSAWVSQGGGGGTGDVTGPSSSTSGTIAVFSGTSGKIIADATNLIATATNITPATAGTFSINGFVNTSGAGSSLTLRGGNSTGNLGGAISVTAGSTQQSGNGATTTITGGSNTVGGGGTTIVAAGTSNAASQSGGNLSLRGGQPGSGGTAGSIGMTTGTSAGGSTRLTIDGSGNIIPGTAALATTATDGFIYSQSCAGTPTGVPAATATGRVPLIIDSTNNRLYSYISGWVQPALNALLTGFSAAAGTVSSSDSILTAINKIVGNLGLLATPEVDHGDMGATETIDFATGPAHYGNISAACTVTLSNVVSGSAYSVVIEANGTDDITWAGPTIDWGTDGQPDFTALADGDLTLINFYYSGTKTVVLASYKSY